MLINYLMHDFEQLKNKKCEGGWDKKMRTIKFNCPHLS